MKSRFLQLLLLLGLSCCGAGSAMAELKVASLHPLLTDLAKQIGGDKVTVLAVVAAGTDVHHFSPSTQHMKQVAGADLVLASGKGLENYLGKLRDNMRAGQVLLEVGEAIPSLELSEAAALMAAAEQGHAGHVHGGVDPHWWNSVDNMQRAIRVVTAAFSKADASNAAVYEANAAAYGKKLGELKKWAKREFSNIPSGQRKLATAHLSLGYFGQEFGFKLIPVQGLNPEIPATSKDLAAAVNTIRSSKVRAVFPEQGVNPKHLAKIAAETGVVFGGELVADGNGIGPLSTFTGAFEHNVREMVKALVPAP